MDAPSTIKESGSGAYRPQSTEDLVAVVQAAVSAETPLELIGLGSKRALGRPVQAACEVAMTGFSGITLYEPEELVLSARAGTPMSEITAALDEKGQMLAFEPPDLTWLWHEGGAEQTLGGMIGTGLSGPRRLSAGGARDHVLGFEAVSGRGEAFKAGGRVVKNVTGYDLCKLVTGAYGTLVALTDLTVKVLPAPETAATVVVAGIPADQASRVMATAMGLSCEVTSAAWLPAGSIRLSGVSGLSEAAGGAGSPAVLLRLEGIPDSVDSRVERLAAVMEGFGPTARLDDGMSRPLWAEIRDARLIDAGAGRCLWRMSVPPAEGGRIAARLEADGATVLLDRAGGQIWVSLIEAGRGTDDPARAALIRSAFETTGHATLIKADRPVRDQTDVFQPQDPALSALSARIKESFDPNGILNPGRMYRGV